jgi:hypothetical protein
MSGRRRTTPIPGAYWIPLRLAARKLSPATALCPILQQANRQSRSGELTTGRPEILVETGAFLRVGR